MGLIRLILALAVVLEHSQPIYGYFCVPASTAVSTFFMISGFYMAMICAEKYNSANGMRAFYSNRILRLLPTYWIALVLALFVRIYLHFANLGPSFAWADEIENCTVADIILLAIPNLTLLGSDLLFIFSFSGNGSWHFNLGMAENRAGRFLLDGPAWSVGTELWFYLLVPFMARWRTLWLIGVGFASLALRIYMERSVEWSSYFFFPANLVLFVAGMLSYRMFRSEKLRALESKYGLPVLWGVIAYIACRQYIPFVRNYSISLYLPIFVCLPLLFQTSKNWSLDRRVGNLSYPIYILHAPLLLLLQSQFSLNDGLSAIVVTVSIAMLVLKIVEEPLDRYRQKRVYETLRIARTLTT